MASPQEIKAEELTYVRNIADGGMASIDLCRWQRDGTYSLVVKKCLLKRNTLRYKANLESEMGILYNVKHDNIVTVFGLVQSTAEFGIIMKYYKFGSYYDAFIETNYLQKRADQEMLQLYPLKLRMLKEIASAMEYLHSRQPKRILHLDIKPDNVLIDDGLHAVLSDFGLSKAKTVTRLRNQTTSSHAQSTTEGTRFYIAPEHIGDSKRERSVESDVYAFGILAWQVLTDLNPYEAGAFPTSSLFYHHVQTGSRPEPQSIPSFVSKIFSKNIVEDCWVPEPSDRPHFPKICEIIRKEISQMEEFKESLKVAIDVAMKFMPVAIDDLPSHDTETIQASAKQISWETVKQSIQKRGGISRLQYGDHTIIGSTEMSFRGLKLVWNCKCMDVNSGESENERGRQSAFGACEHAASRLIRRMIAKGIYPRPIDEHTLKS